MTWPLAPFLTSFPTMIPQTNLPSCSRFYLPSFSFLWLHVMAVIAFLYSHQIISFSMQRFFFFFITIFWCQACGRCSKNIFEWMNHQTNKTLDYVFVDLRVNFFNRWPQEGRSASLSLIWGESFLVSKLRSLMKNIKSLYSQKYYFSKITQFSFLDLWLALTKNTF